MNYRYQITQNCNYSADTDSLKSFLRDMHVKNIRKINTKNCMPESYTFTTNHNTACDIDDILQWYGCSVYCTTDNIGYIARHRLTELLAA